MICAALSTPTLADGQGILKHLLGGRDAAVTTGVAKAGGLDGLRSRR